MSMSDAQSCAKRTVYATVKTFKPIAVIAAVRRKHNMGVYIAALEARHDEVDMTLHLTGKYATNVFEQAVWGADKRAHIGRVG